MHGIEEQMMKKRANNDNLKPIDLRKVQNLSMHSVICMYVCENNVSKTYHFWKVYLILMYTYLHIDEICSSLCEEI